MSAAFLLQSFNATTIFAARPFLATFLLSLLARYTNLIPTAPGWFITTTTLWVLGGLAIVEILAAKDTNVRLLIEEVEPFIKAMMNFLVVFVLVDPGLAETGLLAEMGEARSIMQLLWPMLTAGSVWIMATLRKHILRSFAEYDQEDDIGLQGLLSWVEDLWSVFGLLLAVVFPVVALALYGATFLGLFLARAYMRRLEEKRKIPCSNCNTPIHGSAPSCPVCSHPNPDPRQVGLLGQARKRVVTEPDIHRQHLLSRRRCPVCATRLPHNAIQQTCPACQTATFANAADVDKYLSNLRATLPRILLMCFALSFVPILGIIPGVIYYHVSMIASLRGYVPRSIGCVTRWLVTILNLFLIGLQWIPLLGAFVLPLMCLTNYKIYRRMLEWERKKAFANP